jgi:GrpB-like predicted nucleotidyltransferase (UPF0157 family)
VNGQKLAGALWADWVAPALARLGVDGDCGATLLGPGSEVLGLDDDRSTDHDFGPRLQLFVAATSDVDRRWLTTELDASLPDTIEGRPVRFSLTGDPVVRHRVEVTTVGRFFASTCGIDPTIDPIPAVAWLRAPTQRLASLTAGVVLADPHRELAAARATIAWYPDAVWRYVLGCQWRRLAQHEAFIGRAGEVGDDVGSRIIAGRQARDLLRLGFLVERRWAPYDKWLGAAFGRLALAADVAPHLEVLVGSATWADRQAAYASAAATLAKRFNALELVEPLDPTPRPFHDRPFVVLGADRFADACLVESPLRSRGWRGAVDQWTDSTDVADDLVALAAGDDTDADLGLDDRLRRPVVVVAYRPSWPGAFAAWAEPIREALGPRAVDVEHIGSTSVPGLSAKDVIDVQVLVRSLDPVGPIDAAFDGLGYVRSNEPWNRRDPVPPGWDGPLAACDKLVFRSPGDVAPPANVHVRAVGSPAARQAQLFRDYLRADDEARATWGRFKTEVAARVRHLAAYGQVKAPATELLLVQAERWALDTGWTPAAGTTT